jgi:predicted aspartyl protease
MRTFTVVALSVALSPLAALSPVLAQPVSVPFELYRHEILVTVRLEDRGPYVAMIDTGTDPSAIDVGLARELGLKLGNGGAIDGGGTESVKAFETNLPSVDLGPLAATNVEALATGSVATIAEKLGRPVRIVLGKSFLNGRIVQLDYPSRELRFLPRSPDTRENPGKVAVLRFRYEDDVELEGVRVNDKPVRAILDTGSNGSLKITPEAVARLGLESQAKAGTESKGTGYRGTYASREGHVERLDLGSVRVEKPEATFWLPKTGHDGNPWDVNIGNVVLEKFLVTLDTVAGRLVIESPQP